MPRAKNNAEMNRHARHSRDWWMFPNASLDANLQQLTEATRYSTTVSQPPMVGSPIPGDQLKCGI
jgi:hypothetical protein